MTQGADSNGKAEALKDTAENQVSRISTTSDKDALGDKSLDEVSGGLWPAVMSGSTYNKTI